MHRAPAPRRAWRAALASGAVWLGGYLGSAVPEAAAQPEPGATPIRIWYRSGQDCPDGNAFVARLTQLGRSARLANVGDRVDFVVTLAAGAEKSTGQLERQTERGTVAIRQLDAAACQEVAEALALSLELALAPAADTPTRAGAPDPALPAAPTGARVDAADDRRTAAASAERESVAGARWGLGARAALVTGLAPGLGTAAALFAELGDARGGATGRLSLGGAYARGAARSTELEVTLLTGRLDACIPGLRASAGSVQPCAGIDAGLLQANSNAPSARTDRGPWGAAFVSIRARLGAWRELVPEAEVGVSVPFPRYTFGAAEAGDLYRSDAVSLGLSLGARWSP